MKKFLLVLTAIVLSFSLVFSFTACKDPDGGNQDPDDSITDITLNPAAGTLSFTGASDSAKEITATVTPDSAKNKDVTWSIVTGDDVVSIVQDGKKVTVTPKKDGTASIKVVANGKNSVSKTVAIGVGADNQIVSVTGVTVSPKTLSLTVGGATGTLTPAVAPTDATNKSVTWESSNTGVATVAGGVVTAVSAGTATITVKTQDGEKTDTCAVTVTGGGSGPTNHPLILSNNNQKATFPDGLFNIVKTASSGYFKITFVNDADGGIGDASLYLDTGVEWKPVKWEMIGDGSKVYEITFTEIVNAMIAYHSTSTDFTGSITMTDIGEFEFQTWNPNEFESVVFYEE